MASLLRINKNKGRRTALHKKVPIAPTLFGRAGKSVIRADVTGAQYASWVLYTVGTGPGTAYQAGQIQGVVEYMLPIVPRTVYGLGGIPPSRPSPGPVSLAGVSCQSL